MQFLYPRAESNRHPENRNLIFYPLNYRAIFSSRQDFPYINGKIYREAKVQNFAGTSPNFDFSDYYYLCLHKT